MLEVKGHSSFEVPPELAELTATVSTTARTTEAAVAAHERRVSQAVAALETLKADGLEITQSTFRLSKDRPPSLVGPASPAPNPPPPPEFTAVSTFSLRLKPLASLNKVAARLAESGVLELSTAHFEVEDQRAVLLRARRAAMSDAREQADAYADAGGFRLVEVLSVTDGEAAPLQGVADFPMRSATVIIPPTRVRFGASVEVVWRIAPR